MRKSFFTLIEIIVVLVIIMLVTGIAVSALRGESPSQTLERNTLEFEAFLAKVRFLCAESGRDYVVRYYPDENMFCAHIAYTDEELEDMEEDITESSGTAKFTLGEELEFFIAGEADNYFADDEYVEIFRFYPTGGGACVNKPGIRIDELERYFDISYFSGQVVVYDGDGSREEEE
ncbi:MAG: hypothetical protein E7053_08545 [Lentisphaerae bacterium]|nr:hypothetical protein [Lentisphaerota bacterium]